MRYKVQGMSDKEDDIVLFRLKLENDQIIVQAIKETEAQEDWWNLLTIDSRGVTLHDCVSQELDLALNSEGGLKINRG